MNRREFSKFSAVAPLALAFSRKLADAMPNAEAARPTAGGPEPLRPKLSESYREYCFDFNWVDKLEGHVKPLSNYANVDASREVEYLVKI